LLSNGRAFRLISDAGVEDLAAIEASGVVADFQADGRLIGAKRIDDAARPDDPVIRNHGGPVLEHPRVAFPTYPAEWTPGMLWDAARLTIDLAIALVEEGLGLKDATPSNVLWRGANPVFVDLMSIEKRNPLDPLWYAEAQFARTFLIPLAANRYAGLGLDQIFLADREGLSPEALVRMMPWHRRWLPPVLGIATLPAKLSRDGAGGGATASLEVSSPEKAAFMLGATLKRQRRRLDRLKPLNDSRTDWAQYGPRRHYSEAALKTKEAFVRDALTSCRPARVVDLGCNDGAFSRIAAEQGASVIATDLDTPSLDQVLMRARADGLDIQPVRVNFAQPGPASGWQGRERLSFDERMAGTVDMAMALAVIHHLQMAERIPLPEIAAWLAAMTRDVAVVEYVGPGDPMAKGLIAARRAPVAFVEPEDYDAVFAEYFEIVRTEAIPGMDRRMLLLKKR